MKGEDPKKPEVVNKIGTEASELLRELIAALDSSNKEARSDGRQSHFANGISSIEVQIEQGASSARVHITAAGSPQNKRDSGIATQGVPESCRAAAYFRANDDFKTGDHEPADSEVSTCGKIKKPIRRDDPEFANLVRNTNSAIVFKDEEGTGADRMMTHRLKEKLDTLASAVAAEWAGVKLRVTEAWDEDNEHAGNSLHYEGRAADLTTDDKDSAKLGRLARLAVNAGLDWTWYENSAHIHVSVRA